jgi:hypothetical protein
LDADALPLELPRQDGDKEKRKTPFCKVKATVPTMEKGYK